MSWDDRHNPRRNQVSRLIVPITIFGAAIFVFSFGLIAPAIFRDPQKVKPQQVAQAPGAENANDAPANADDAQVVPTTPIPATVEPPPLTPRPTVTQPPPPSSGTQNSKLPNAATPQPAPQNPTTPPTTNPSEQSFPDTEPEVLTVRVRPGTPAIPSSPTPPAYRPPPTPNSPTPNSPIPPNNFTPNPAPFAPTPTPNPQFSRPSPSVQITESKPAWKSKLPAVELPDQDLKEEVTLHQLPESFASIPIDKQEFSLDVSAAAVPKGMALVVQKQLDQTGLVWQVSLEPAPKTEAEAKPAVSTPDAGQPSATSTAAPEVKALVSQRVGAFRVINGELRYRWLGSTPETAQVANCVANVRWNGNDEKILLRKAERTQNLSLSLSKLPPNFPTGAEIPPKAESIQFVLVELAGFDETVDIEPDNGTARVGSRVKVRPNHALNVEFDLGIIVRSDGLAIQPRPTFLLTENNRQEFTTDKLQSVMTLTNNRIQKDIGRLQFAQSRLRDIPGEISRLSSVNAQAAVKAAALTALQREAKSSDSTVRSLTVSIPKSQEVLQQLDHYRKYAEQLDGRLKLRGRLVALADTAEIPLWIAE